MNRLGMKSDESSIGETFDCPLAFLTFICESGRLGPIRVIGFLFKRVLQEGGSCTLQESRVISLTHRELISEAGISVGNIGRAMKDAQSAGWISILPTAGRARTRVTFSIPKGSEDLGAVKVPGWFLSCVLPNETLNMARFLGGLLRAYGGRNAQSGFGSDGVRLSYGGCMELCGIGSQSDVRKVKQRAIDRGYVIAQSDEAVALHDGRGRSVYRLPRTLERKHSRFADRSKTLLDTHVAI